VDAGRITLALSTRDRPQLVARFVVPALPLFTEEGFPVVIVDQSGSGETEGLLREVPGITLLRSEPGLARAHNVAIEATRTELIAFTDDDVTIEPAWLYGIVAEFDRAPDVGAVCGRVVDRWGRLLPGKESGIYRWPMNPIGLGTGANIAFRRAALVDTGPFDEELGIGAEYRAGEETDMLYRVMRAGWTVACSDQLTVMHHDWRTVRDELALHYGYGLGAGAQFGKHAAEGDWTAGRIALKEAGRHCLSFLRGLARLQPRVVRLQPPFLAGLAVGFVRRYRAVKARPGPGTRP
jgi:hypothetical protein